MSLSKAIEHAKEQRKFYNAAVARIVQLTEASPKEILLLKNKITDLALTTPFTRYYWANKLKQYAIDKLTIEEILNKDEGV